MNPFEIFCNDKITIRHSDGRVTGPLKVSFSKDKFTVYDKSLDVSEGDSVERALPNGKTEDYQLIHVHFSQGLQTIPPHFELQVRKRTSLVQSPKSTTHISISNSQGFQVGDHNTQNIVDSFKQVIERIEQGPGTADQKREAKSLLKAFLEHPLTSAIVGSATGALAALLI